MNLVYIIVFFIFVFFLCSIMFHIFFFFFFSSRRRHTRCGRDWSSDVCSSDLLRGAVSHGTDYANYSSGFYLPVNDNISIPELNQRIRNKLKSGEHWLNWQQANIAKYLPGIVIRWIYKAISKKNYYAGNFSRSEEHTSELQSRPHLVCRLLLEKKK